jgi:hypothetical protein
MATEEIGGGEAFTSFGLNFEEVKKALTAAYEDAAGIGADDGAGCGACVGVFDAGAVNF